MMQGKKSGIKPRWSKVLADLWDNKTRTLLVVLSIAVGVFAVGTIVNAFNILNTDIDASYAAVNPANITIPVIFHVAYVPGLPLRFLVRQHVGDL